MDKYSLSVFDLVCLDVASAIMMPEEHDEFMEYVMDKYCENEEAGDNVEG